MIGLRSSEQRHRIRILRTAPGGPKLADLVDARENSVGNHRVNRYAMVKFEAHLRRHPAQETTRFHANFSRLKILRFLLFQH